MIIQNSWYSVICEMEKIHITTKFKSYNLHGPMIERYFLPSWKKICYGIDENELYEWLIVQNPNIKYYDYEYNNIINQLEQNKIINKIDNNNMLQNYEIEKKNLTVINLTMTDISSKFEKLLKENITNINCDRKEYEVCFQKGDLNILLDDTEIVIVFMDRYSYEDFIKVIQLSNNINTILPVVIDSGVTVIGPDLINKETILTYIDKYRDIYSKSINNIPPQLYYDNILINLTTSLVCDEVINLIKRNQSFRHYQLKLVNNIEILNKETLSIQNIKL